MRRFGAVVGGVTRLPTVTHTGHGIGVLVYINTHVNMLADIGAALVRHMTFLIKG